MNPFRRLLHLARPLAFPALENRTFGNQELAPRSRGILCQLLILVITAGLWAFPARALALVHPGVLHDTADLNRMKANLNVDPWKSGYLALSSQATASLSYTMQGPFSEVGREPNVHRTEYESDMTAIYHQAIMYYLTGNRAYADKSIAILNAWASTHTIWSGNGTWSGLMRGDYGYLMAAGAEILRYTYPGWTTANTTTASNYILNMYWSPLGPWTNPTTDNLGAGNQGLGCLKGLMSFAIFLNDQAKFDYCVNVYRNTTNCVSLNRNSLATGQNAESGRDQAHSSMEMAYMTIIAELGRKQGVTFYSDLGNRVLAINEYWCGYNLGNSVSYSTFGPCGNSYGTISSAERGLKFPMDSLEMAYAEYVLRQGLAAPFTSEYRSLGPIVAETFLFNQQPVPATPETPAGLIASAGSGVVSLSWRPSLGAVTYNVKRGTISGGAYTTIATGRLSPNLNFVDAGLTNGTTYFYAVSAVSGSGTESLVSSQVSATPKDLTLTGTDLSGATPAGVFSSNGSTFTINGGGSDIGTGGDVAYFASRIMTGDGAITVRLVSGATGKIGIQMRNGLLPTSASVTLVVDSGRQVRSATRREGDSNLYWSGSVAGSAPQWLRIRRSGDSFQMSSSPDGLTWTSFGTASIEMNETVNVGMIVCSRNSTALATATFDNLTIGSGNALTSPWLAEDIGAIKSPGNTTLSNGIYSVQGSGSDIGSAADSFHYASLVVNGNSRIIARLATQTYGGSSNDKAGVMMRESNASNAKSVSLLYDRATGTARIATRVGTGSGTDWTGGTAMAAPRWLKLERTGNSFNASISSDGVVWTLIGTSTVTMNADILVGLAVCSRDPALNTTTFDNVAVAGNGVTFYRDMSYGGLASMPLPVGDYTTAQLLAAGMPADWASSVTIPAGRTVILYSDDNFSGTSWTLTGSTPNLSALSPSANDQISSCRVQ